METSIGGTCGEHADLCRLEDMVKTLTRLRGKKYRKGGRHTSYFFQWGEIVISCGSSVRVKSGGHDGIL